MKRARRRWRIIRYSSEELRWLEANRTLTNAECLRQFSAKFNRAELTKLNIRDIRQRLRNPASVRPKEPTTNGAWGKALTRHKPVGSIRMGQDGYLQIKINEDLPTDRRFIHCAPCHSTMPGENKLGPSLAGVFGRRRSRTGRMRRPAPLKIAATAERLLSVFPAPDRPAIDLQRPVRRVYARPQLREVPAATTWRRFRPTSCPEKFATAAGWKNPRQQ